MGRNDVGQQIGSNGWSVNRISQQFELSLWDRYGIIYSIIYLMRIRDIGVWSQFQFSC